MLKNATNFMNNYKKNYMKNYKRNSKTGRGLVFVSLAWLMHPSASGQTDMEILESLRSCRDVEAMSSRLACYDEIPLPEAGTIERSNPATLREEPVASRPAPESLDDTSVRIVEVERPRFSTFRYITADGRVFVQSNSLTIPQLPDTPFDAEIQTSSLLGNSTYLSIPQTQQRFRVVLEN